jgi:hypothetical protein
MPPSVFARNSVADHFFRTASYPKPTQLHLGLWTATGEVVGFGYSRLRHDPLDANWSRPSDGTIVNAVDLVFPDPVGGGWGTIIEARLFDQNGIELQRGALSAFRTVNQGDPGPKFPAGSILFTIPG